MTEKKTKIICTISDINCEKEFIRNLYLNGLLVNIANNAVNATGGYNLVAVLHGLLLLLELLLLHALRADKQEVEDDDKKNNGDDIHNGDGGGL